MLPLVRQKWETKSRSEVYRNDPVKWCVEFLGIHPWKKQRDILYSIRDNRATAVAAGHGVGKTFIVAVAACWWVDVHDPSETFVASTAPSADQVDLLWDNMRMVHNLASERHEEYLSRKRDGVDLGEYAPNDHALIGYINGKNKWMFNGGTLGQGRKPPDNKSDIAFQGRHATYLLAIGDEAVGLSTGFLNALGVIATGQYNRQCLIANPTDPTCAMAKIWKDKNDQWVTMHISVMDSPRITPEEGYDVEKWAPGLSGHEYVEQALSDYNGKDDPRYISRVLGQWAFDSGNNMFTEEELARGRNCVVLPDLTLRPELGLDIARGGKDASVVYVAWEGDVWDTDENGDPTAPNGKRGIQLRLLDTWKKAPLTGGNLDNPGTSERIHAHMLGQGSEILKYDVAGIGAGVSDGLATLNEYQYFRHGYIWFEVYGQSTKNVDRRLYENARVEQYFGLKNKLHGGILDIDPTDDKLQEDLRGVIYEYTSKGRLKIEAKDDMKKRGAKSPDFSDAAWYACYDVSELLDPMAQIQSGTRLALEAEYDDVSEYSDGYGAPV